MKSFKWKKFLNAPAAAAAAAAAAIQRWGFPLSYFTTTDKKAFTFSWLISQVSFLLYTAAAAATVPQSHVARAGGGGTATMWCATVAATAATAVSTAGAALKRLQRRTMGQGNRECKETSECVSHVEKLELRFLDNKNK